MVCAAVEASRLRLRPIVMTSLVFTLGIVPLVIAKGLSSDTQNALGTGLFGGMISATILAVLGACLRRDLLSGKHIRNCRTVTTWPPCKAYLDRSIGEYR